MNKSGFKVEFRKTCLNCSAPITEKRFRTYCSKKCRNHVHNMKAMPGNTEWQRKNRAKKATYRKDKKKCIICGLWYVQVGSHIVQVHKMTAREYREMYDLPVKCGITAEEYKKRKGEVVFKNKTVENLKSGKKNWYSKDDPRAKKNTGWKGRNGSKGYVANEYYG